MGRLVDAEYVEETIAIVLTRLPNLLRLHDHCPTSPPFVSRLQSILVYWIKEVMIPMPTGSQEVLDQLQPLDAWTCACEHCVSVRAFLQEEPEGEMTWYKIGAPTVKHLTKFLKAHAGGIAAWSTVRSCSPQGIEVTKQPAFVNPVRWASYRARGVRLLQSIGANVAVDVLRDVLGQYLPLVAAALSGRAEPYDAVLEAENVLRGLLAQIRGETETLRDIRTRSPCCAAAEAATLATDAIADEEADPTVVEPLVAGALKRPRSPSPFPASLDSTLSGILWRQNHIEDGRAAQRIKREDPEPIELGVKAEDN
ncbi:hypothetical protein K466DRAFT_569449 [Polyporus arcularius HHB13444]|uniref:Uncharacterized protein n=1 Tax=Polyporus arcularius HHB13444 TaxID=1314778 RepID=A0A5C3NXM6_9APHY|nr:hypothetical protein K466DRAFT_569449 [Polyporus arcularius HHB13444]